MKRGTNIKQWWGSHLWDNRGILIPQLLHWINSSLIHELTKTQLIKTSDVLILLLVFWWNEEAVTAKCFLPSEKKQPIQRYACLYHESRLKLLFQGAVVYKNAKNSMSECNNIRILKVNLWVSYLKTLFFKGTYAFPEHSSITR